MKVRANFSQEGFLCKKPKKTKILVYRIFGRFLAIFCHPQLKKNFFRKISIFKLVSFPSYKMFFYESGICCNPMGGLYPEETTWAICASQSQKSTRKIRKSGKNHFLSLLVFLTKNDKKQQKTTKMTI